MRHKHTLLHRDAWAGIGLGIIITSVVFIYIGEATTSALVKVGIVGLLLFVLVKRKSGRKHNF